MTDPLDTVPAAGRLTLLVTSPRVAPGLLTDYAWAALHAAGTICGRLEEPQSQALLEAGLAVAEPPAPGGPGPLARALVEAARGRHVVWVGSSDGDPGLTDAVAEEVSRGAGSPDVELLVGSFDVPGAGLLDVIAVMDRLRSPGGCPWDAAQTHTTLAPYLLEEAHEAVEAMETGDRLHLMEELGDVLLQVVFHARVAQEHPEQPFSIDDVAAGLVSKLVRRHPHVFADGEATTPEEVVQGWERIKADEKPHRTGILDGVPPTMSTLARAEKALTRAERAGGDAAVAQALARGDEGAIVLQLVEELRGRGVSAEAALRATLRQVQDDSATGRSSGQGREPEPSQPPASD